MNRERFKQGIHFQLHSREYVIKQRLAGGEWQICDVVTLACSQVKESALLQLLFRGELEIKEIDHLNNSAKKNNYLSADFSQISSLLKDEAKRRYKYTKRVLYQFNMKLHIIEELQTP